MLLPGARRGWKLRVMATESGHEAPVARKVAAPEGAGTGAGAGAAP